MSFLDNLESNLKALESRDERDPKALAREAAAREAARSAALPIAPHAEALRHGPFLNGLLTACRDIGHPRRILVRAVWVDSMFRLETGAKKDWNCLLRRAACCRFSLSRAGSRRAHQSTYRAIPSNWWRNGLRWKR